MARKTFVQLVDDITGDAIPDGGGRTVTFAVDGVQYEIDLNDKNAKKFDETLSFYTDHARKTGGRASRGSAAPRRSASDVDSRAVRAWAASNGVSLSARGRIPASVVEQYRAAGN